MPGISIHVIDVAAGAPPEGMRVELFALSPGGRRRIFSERITASGSFDHPVARGEGIARGAYEIEIHVGEYYRARPGGDPGFLDIVPFRFNIADAREHTHLPIKLTPWGLSLWRGR